jgi:hypothetical protein
MAKKFGSAKDYVLSIRSEIENADENRLLAIAKEMEITYKYILGAFKPTKGDEDSVEEFRGFLEEMVAAEDGDSDAGVSDDEEEIIEVDALSKDVSQYTGEEIADASPTDLVLMYDAWVAKGIKPIAKPGLSPSDVPANERFIDWMVSRQAPVEEVCSLRDFVNPKGCKDGYICDIGANKCIKKVAGQLVEVYNSIELTGTRAEIDQWRRDLEKYKQSLIIRKDGEEDIIIPPCNLLVPGQEDKYKGCGSGEFCDLNTSKCVKAKGDGAEATVNGHKIFGTAEAVRNFVERVRARAKANGTVASIVYDDGSGGHMISLVYTSDELGRKTVKELKELASTSSVYVKSKAVKDEIIAALVSAGVKKPGVPAIEKPPVMEPPAVEKPPVKPPVKAPPKLAQGGPYTAEELDRKTVKELKELASAAKIYIPSKYNKGQVVAELIAKGLRKPDEIEEVIEEPEEPPVMEPPKEEEPPVMEPPKKEEPIMAPPASVVYTKDELNRKTVKELKALAGDAKIYVSSKAVKDAIIQALVDGGLKRPGSAPPIMEPPKKEEPPIIAPPKKEEPKEEPPIIAPPKKEEPIIAPPAAGPYSKKELDQMSVKALRELAKEKSVYIPSKYLKDQIVAELLAKGVSRGASSGEKPPVMEPPVMEPPVEIPPVDVGGKEKPQKDSEKPPVIIKPPVMLPPDAAEEVESKPEKPTLAGIKKLNAGADAARIAALRARMERCAGLVV